MRHIFIDRHIGVQMTCSGLVLAERDNLRVIDCHACGYPHLDQFPTQAELDKYYADSFWQKEKIGWRQIHEAQREWLDVRNVDYLELVERHARDKSLSRALLDVGCGWGFFINVAKERGWGVWGLEPNQDAAKYAVKLIGKQSPRIGISGWDQYDEAQLLSLGLLPKTYDCISALWLIEHLPNPLEFLKWCKSHLTDGGALLLALPNEWSDLQHRANQVAANKDFFSHHTHLNYFSQAHIANLLGLAGFRVVEWSATYPMEKFILSGLDYTAGNGLGRMCHATVRASELAMSRDERLALYADYARRGIGRDLVIVAKVN